MPHRTTKPTKFYTGVSLNQEVVTYLNDIAKRMGWTRSLVIDFIVREHARQNGQEITLPTLKSLIAEKEVSPPR